APAQRELPGARHRRTAPLDASGSSHKPVACRAGCLGAGHLRCPSTKGPLMAITINRQQREAIYQEVVLDLNGLTDLWTEFDDGNFDRARELRDRFVLDMRLLDDLGWEPEVEGEAFELTMDGVDLAAVVSRLIEQTGAIIHTQIV